MESDRKIISYIAMSLDGKIAKANGDVHWLDEIPNPDKSDYGYYAFYEAIDTTIMGNSTYQEVLNMGVEFPYKGKKNFVFTRDKSAENDENVTFVSDHLEDFISNLLNGDGKDIWLVGGGKLNSLFLRNNWIDEMRVFVMPKVLGDGIPLFASGIEGNHLKLIETVSYASGVVELKYKTTRL